MSKLYQRVREARKRVALSQEQLAMDLDVTRSAVGQWEMKDGTAPSVENLAALARRTGMAFEYLATGRGAKIQGEPMALMVREEAIEYRHLSPQQYHLLMTFERMTPRQRSSLIDFLDAIFTNAPASRSKR